MHAIKQHELTLSRYVLFSILRGNVRRTNLPNPTSVEIPIEFPEGSDLIGEYDSVHDLVSVTKGDTTIKIKTTDKDLHLSHTKFNENLLSSRYNYNNLLFKAIYPVLDYKLSELLKDNSPLQVILDILTNLSDTLKETYFIDDRHITLTIKLQPKALSANIVDEYGNRLTGYTDKEHKYHEFKPMYINLGNEDVSSKVLALCKKITTFRLNGKAKLNTTTYPTIKMLEDKLDNKIVQTKLLFLKEYCYHDLYLSYLYSDTPKETEIHIPDNYHEFSQYTKSYTDKIISILVNNDPYAKLYATIVLYANDDSIRVTLSTRSGQTWFIEYRIGKYITDPLSDSDLGRFVLGYFDEQDNEVIQATHLGNLMMRYRTNANDILGLVLAERERIEGRYKIIEELAEGMKRFTPYDKRARLPYSPIGIFQQYPELMGIWLMVGYLFPDEE